jgi:hypothetical protein
MALNTSEKPVTPEPVRYAWLQMGCAYAFVWFWLLGWSAGTLMVDLLALSGLVVGELGEALLVVLFSIPFNAVSVGLWSLIALRVFVKKETLVSLGHFKIFDDGQELRIRVPRITPFWAAFLVAFVAPIVTGIPVATVFSWTPPVPIAAAALILVLGSIVLAYRVTARTVASGKSDVVINRIEETLTLPQTFGRLEPIVIPWADLTEVHVAEEERTDKEGAKSTFFVLKVRWQDSTGSHAAIVAELMKVIGQNSEEYARNLGAMIRKETGR